jgi:hypothetical protein
MFGNRLGWGISAVLSALILLLVWYLGTLNAISPPSTGIVARTGNVALNLLDHPEILDPIQLPFSPQAVMPAMTDPRDAAPLYRQALEKYAADNSIYHNLFEKGKPKTTDLKDLPALQFLIDARNCKTMNLYGSKPEEILGYDRDASDRVEAIYTLGKTASRLALYIQKEQPDQALVLAEAAFSLGVKLCDERLRWREFDSGAELARDGAFIIKKLDPTRAQPADIDAPMAQLLKDRCIPVWTAINSADQQVISRTSGDMFYIAKNAKERMWRIEAVLKLGRNRFNIGEFGRGADQRWSALTVKRMSNDASLDPAVRAAAKAATDLTLPEYNSIGG